VADGRHRHLLVPDERQTARAVEALVQFTTAPPFGTVWMRSPWHPQPPRRDPAIDSRRSQQSGFVSA